MDYSPSGSSIHEIFQARVLEWVVISFQGIFLTQGSNLGLPHCGQTPLPSEPPGKCFSNLPLRFEISQIASLSHQCPNSGPHNSHQNYITTDSQLVSLILLCPSQVWSLDNTDKQHMRKRWGRTRKKFSQGIKDPIIFLDKWLKLDSPGSLSERESSLPTQCVYRKRRGYSCGQFRDSKMTQCSHTEWSENTGFHNVDKGSIPGSGRPPGEGNGKPLWYSCPENLMDRGTWQATVHGVAESDTT